MKDVQVISNEKGLGEKVIDSRYPIIRKKRLSINQYINKYTNDTIYHD